MEKNNLTVKKGCRRTWRGYWQKLKILINREKSFKDNAQAKEKIENILYYRGTGVMLVYAVKGFIWEASIKSNIKNWIEFSELEAKKEGSTFKIEIVRTYVHLIPWVLVALDVLRVILILISLKWRRINRWYVYLNHLYLAVLFTQPSIRNGSFNEYAYWVATCNIISFLSLACDFWGPLAITIV